MKPTTPQKTLSLRQLLMEGFISGRRAYSKTFPIALMMLAITQFFLIPPAAFLMLSAIDFKTNPVGFSTLPLLLSFILLIVVFLVLSIGWTLSLIFTASFHQKKTCPLKVAVSLMSSVLPQVLLAGIFMAFLFSLGFSVSPFLTFGVAIFLPIYLPIVIFETSSAWGGLAHSINRTRKALTYSAFIVGIIWLLMFGTASFIHFLFSSIENSADLQGIEGLVRLLVDALIFPFSQGLIISLYFNLR